MKISDSAFAEVWVKHERVRPGPTGERIDAALTIEDVVTLITDDYVIEVVARAIDVARSSGQCEVLDPGRQRVADRRDDRVVTLVYSWKRLHRIRRKPRGDLVTG